MEYEKCVHVRTYVYVFLLVIMLAHKSAHAIVHSEYECHLVSEQRTSPRFDNDPPNGTFGRSLVRWCCAIELYTFCPKQVSRFVLQLSSMRRTPEPCRSHRSKKRPTESRPGEICALACVLCETKTCIFRHKITPCHCESTFNTCIHIRVSRYAESWCFYRPFFIYLIYIITVSYFSHACNIG